MTGIAIGVLNVPKISVGNTLIAKVSVGDVLVWPSAPAITGYLIDFFLATLNFQISSLRFNRPAPIQGSGTITQTTGGTVQNNTHPPTWITNPATTEMWARVNVITPPSNGVVLNITRNDIGMVENVWTQVTAAGTPLLLLVDAVNQPNGSVVQCAVRVELRATQNGPTVYDAISNIRVEKGAFI